MNPKWGRLYEEGAGYNKAFMTQIWIRCMNFRTPLRSIEQPRYFCWIAENKNHKEARTPTKSFGTRIKHLSPNSFKSMHETHVSTCNPKKY